MLWLPRRRGTSHLDTWGSTGFMVQRQSEGNVYPSRYLLVILPVCLWKGLAPGSVSTLKLAEIVQNPSSKITFIQYAEYVRYKNVQPFRL